MAFTMAATMAAGNRVLGGGEVARPCLVADRSLCSELVRAEAGQRSGDGADDVSDDDDGAGDGAGEDRAIEPEGLGLGRSAWPRHLAEAETSVSTAWGWEYAERAATRNAGYSSEAGGGATAN